MEIRRKKKCKPSALITTSCPHLNYPIARTRTKTHVKGLILEKTNKTKTKAIE